MFSSASPTPAEERDGAAPGGFPIDNGIALPASPGSTKRLTTGHCGCVEPLSSPRRIRVLASLPANAGDTDEVAALTSGSLVARRKQNGCAMLLPCSSTSRCRPSTRRLACGGNGPQTSGIEIGCSVTVDGLDSGRGEFHRPCLQHPQGGDPGRLHRAGNSLPDRQLHPESEPLPAADPEDRGVPDDRALRY